MKIQDELKFFTGALLILFTSVIQAQTTKPPDKKKPMPIAEQLINSTVQIESLENSFESGQIKPKVITGTAFFYIFKIDTLSIPVLITNYHNVENTNVNVITFTLTDTLGKSPKKRISYKWNSVSNPIPWLKHPKYDLALIPLLPVMNQVYSETKKYIFYIGFSEDQLVKKEKITDLSAIEPLLMIGYPKGYGDKFNNYPIVRRGTTATPIWSNFNDQSEFLLDIPIYQGSSGSPVVLLDDGMYGSNAGLVVGGVRLFLTGIATQSVDFKMQTSGNALQLENPLNIAVVLKADALADFVPIIKKIVESELSLQQKSVKKK